MKYLWLCIFCQHDGRVPIFIELRRLNDMTSDDLMANAFNSIIDTSTKVSHDYFTKAARDGLFTFIFDGFDEVNHEKRASIERQILKFANDNPKAPIVVSSRPDDQLEAWQSFSNYRILPFSKTQVIDLLSKIQYDKKIKLKFINNVRDISYLINILVFCQIHYLQP